MTTGIKLRRLWCRVRMFDLVVRFLPSVTILSVIISISIFSIVRVIRSSEFSCAETWTANERTRVWWLKMGTTIAVVLC